jgi:hypothetical protein
MLDKAPMGTWIKNPVGKQLHTNSQLDSLPFLVSISIQVVNRRVHGQWCLGVSRRIPSIVTWFNDHSPHVNQTAHNGSQIEGHVPQGVEVQVLSSALSKGTWMAFEGGHVP